MRRCRDKASRPTPHLDRSGARMARGFDPRHPTAGYLTVRPRSRFSGAQSQGARGARLGRPGHRLPYGEHWRLGPGSLFARGQQPASCVQHVLREAAWRSAAPLASILKPSPARIRAIDGLQSAWWLVLAFRGKWPTGFWCSVPLHGQLRRVELEQREHRFRIEPLEDRVAAFDADLVRHRAPIADMPDHLEACLGSSDVAGNGYLKAVGQAYLEAGTSHPGQILDWPKT